MTNPFKKATKEKQKAKVALIGPSGSGKTYTALRMAKALGDRIAVIDTEHGSASLYADQFDFDTLELERFDPRIYIKAMRAAEAAGYDVLIVDSLSHAWMGKDGALELVDKMKSKYGGNQFAAWGDVTPIHRDLIETILATKLHLIATMRSKTEYVVEEDSRGKQRPRKVGMAPIQRDGMEYEFSVVGTLDVDHTLVIDKTRCPDLDGQIFNKPGEDVAKILLDWLNAGAEVQPAPETVSDSEPEPLSSSEAAEPEPTPEPTGNGNRQHGKKLPTVRTGQFKAMMKRLPAYYDDEDDQSQWYHVLGALVKSGWNGDITDDNVEEAFRALVAYANDNEQLEAVS